MKVKQTSMIIIIVIAVNLLLDMKWNYFTLS